MSYELSSNVIDEIENWKSKFPADKKRSVIISALHAVQHMKSVRFHVSCYGASPPDDAKHDPNKCLNQSKVDPKTNAS